MSVAGCERCGCTDADCGRYPPKPGGLWKRCPHCSGELRWMLLPAALELARECAEADLRRIEAGYLSRSDASGQPRLH